MKLNEIESKEMSLTVSIGSWIGDGIIPPPAQKKAIESLRKKFKSPKFLKKYNGHIIGELSNSSTKNYKITIGFDSSKDRMSAVKDLRKEKNEYIRTVQSQ